MPKDTNPPTDEKTIKQDKEDHKKEDELLDEVLKETFPASDPGPHGGHV